MRRKGDRGEIESLSGNFAPKTPDNQGNYRQQTNKILHCSCGLLKPRQINDQDKKLSRQLSD
jgi:hypothetical protein